MGQITMTRRILAGARSRYLFVAILGFVALAGKQVGGQSADEYLYSGKLVEGENALLAKLESEPKNDQARFGLGVIQFGRALENFLQQLNRHGFLTERAFGPVLEPDLRAYFPDDPDPKPYSNEVFRRLIHTWVADVTKAEKTLAKITDPDVKLRLKPALIQFDPVGKGKPISAATLLALMFPVEEREQIDEFELALDRGDVHWLRGYLHFQAALGELLLALDFSELVEIGGHRLFEKVETPHDWLLGENRKINSDDMFFFEDELSFYVDWFAIVTRYLDIPVSEPDHLKVVLQHLEGTIANGQKMWEFILAETDDDNEWIPNPRQTGSIDVAVNQEMIDTWLETLEEAKLIVQGKKLLPFWRDYMHKNAKPTDRGINLRKVFEDPPDQFSIVLWIQGTAATPYLEQGELTQLADEKFLERINRVFGSNFFGFAFWFN